MGTAILNFYEKNYDVKSLPKRRSGQNSTTDNCFKESAIITPVVTDNCL